MVLTRRYVMNQEFFDRISKNGAIVPMESGEEGVHVTFHYQPRLNTRSRKRRRETLTDKFTMLNEEIREMGVEMKFDTISVSAQSIEAFIPVRTYQSIEENIQAKDVDLTVVENWKIV